MVIRKATIKDLQIIKKYSKKHHFEEKRDWDSLVSSKTSEMFVFIENKKIIGFIGLIYFDWNNTVQIANVFVHPVHRKKRIGSKLINYLKEYLKGKKYRCLIAEAPSTNPILQLYLKEGFRICGFNDRYYSNDTKMIAFWMSYDLK